MKKTIFLSLCLAALLLTGCSKGQLADERMITRPPEESIALSGDATPQQMPAAPEEAPEPIVIAAQGNYTFFTGGVELVPGAAFDPSVLPEAQSVYEVPSCAIVGTDNLYNYGTFELTAFDDGTGEVIYSILITDPSTPTTEGLKLGDKKEEVTALYGENFTEEGTQRIYSGDAELLILIFQGDRVASIEYRMIVATK
ncbi:MAG: hypothetical protein IJO21_06175 [Oscillospiraceae bacterium]|nr:hypothetical protein [Oscillospiraceae bacterium]MBQ7130607.1 hypothetical protein [Oscillospiraceae bacterium]